MKKKNIVILIVSIVAVLVLVYVIALLTGNVKQVDPQGESGSSLASTLKSNVPSEQSAPIDSDSKPVSSDISSSSNPSKASSTDGATKGQLNALRKAESYLKVTAFSRSGLIEQLEYEGYSTEEATYAVDRCGADWMEQAVKKAKSYLNTTAFSKSGLIEQLEYEGFTHEEAVYGAEQNGY